MIVDNIDVGNVFYKSLAYFARAQVAGCVVGATVPIILTSRADSTETKFNSVALGCALAGHKSEEGVGLDYITALQGLKRTMSKPQERVYYQSHLRIIDNISPDTEAYPTSEQLLLKARLASMNPYDVHS